MRFVCGGGIGAGFFAIFGWDVCRGDPFGAEVVGVAFFAGKKQGWHGRCLKSSTYLQGQSL